MIAAAASYNGVTLAYMSRLTDFGVCHCFEGKLFSFDGYLCKREYMLGHIAYQSDVANDLILFIGHCDQYFIVH